MKKALLLFTVVGLVSFGMAYAGTGQWDNAKIETAITQSLAGKPLDIKNPNTHETLKLTFQKVHPEVMPEGKNAGVCADFKDAKGKTYDIDFVINPNYKVLSKKFHQ